MIVMNKRRKGPIGLLVVATAAICGCSADGGVGSGAAAGRPTVVTALYPLGFVVERIGASDIAVQSLAAPGVEAHDVELSPQQVGAVAGASLIVYLGGFAPAVDEAVEQNAADRGFDVSMFVDLLPSPAGKPDEAAAGGVDPHFWLDPRRLAGLASVVSGRLGEIDPDHADDFETRAGALIDELADLDAAYVEGLAGCATTTLVTSHDAFGYLSARYGLEQVSIAGLEPDAEPSAARISEVQDIVRAAGTSTIYFEPLASSAVADAIAADLGVRSASLDPLESPPEAGDYLTVMKDNLAALRAGLRCD